MHFNQQLTALKTLLYKEVRRFMRIWIQTILPPAITTVLYFLIFGQFIGSQLREIDGFSYIDYITPGLILMVAITNSYSNVASSFYSSKFQRSIEELMVSPMPSYLILTGYIVGGALRGIIASFIVFLISLLFTRLPMAAPLYAITTLVMTTILFSLAGLINGVFANSFDDISIIPNFVLTPLTYLGGIFYSISLLPEVWQQVSLLNPILYMINGFRYGLIGVSDISPQIALAMGLFLIAVLAIFCMYLLNRGIGIRK